MIDKDQAQVENGKEDGISTNGEYTQGTEYISRMDNSLPYVCICLLLCNNVILII